MFAEDANHTLWTSGGGEVVGWLNTKMFDETGDEEKSQGWTALVIDTNGNGKRDAYVEPDQPLDPAKDKRFGGAFYAVSPAPDGSIWGSVLGFPGAVVRLNPGANPPETALAEVYEPPFDNPKRAAQGFSPRGMDIDRNGVVWAALASGHLASFDRRKCKGPLNGPKATGQQCPEGWTLYPEPLPQMKGVTESGSAESSYYTWVDQFDTLGLGANVPIDTGNESEGLLRPEGRQVGRAARAVPARLLHEMAGRPHRRSTAADGKAAGCGRRSAPARRSTWRPARARRARWSGSSSGRIHWPSKRDRSIDRSSSAAVWRPARDLLTSLLADVCIVDSRANQAGDVRNRAVIRCAVPPVHRTNYATPVSQPGRDQGTLDRRHPDFALRVVRTVAPTDRS